MSLNGKKCYILILVFLITNIGLVTLSSDFVNFPRDPTLNPRIAVGNEENYVDVWYGTQFGTTTDFSNMQNDNENYATIDTEIVGISCLANQLYQWNTLLYDWDTVELYIDIHSDVTVGNDYNIDVGTNTVSLHYLDDINSQGLEYWDVTPYFQSGSSFYVRIRYTGTQFEVPTNLEIERLYIICTDSNPPSWIKGGAFPADGQWYSTNPVLSLTFEDNINLFDGDWDVNNDNPERFLFGNVDDTSWTNPTWTMTPSVWDSLAQEQLHTLYFDAQDDYSNNGGQSGSWSWTFYKDSLPPDTSPTLATISPDPDYDGNIYLNWDDISDADSYNVYRETSSISDLTGLTPIASPLTSEYNDNSGLSPDEYYYVVTAVDHGGESAISNCESVTVEIAEPEAPVLEAIEPDPDTDGEVILEWDDVSGATSYKVYRSTESIESITGMTPIATPTTSTYSDMGLKSGTYYYVVVAVGPGGESDMSNLRSVVVNIQRLPENFWWWIGGIAAIIGAVPGGYFIIKKFKDRRANKTS